MVLSAGFFDFGFGFVFKGILEGAIAAVLDLKRSAGPGRLSRGLENTSDHSVTTYETFSENVLQIPANLLGASAASC